MGWHAGEMGVDGDKMWVVGSAFVMETVDDFARDGFPEAQRLDGDVANAGMVEGRFVALEIGRMRLVVL